MEPTTGLILLLAWSGLNALIATKRGRSGFAFFCLSTVAVVPVAILASLGSGGNGSIMVLAVFACPLVGFIAAIALPSGTEAAARSGKHGNYVRCPYCAEPVRTLATKCRHCASDLPASTASDPNSVTR